MRRLLRPPADTPEPILRSLSSLPHGRAQSVLNARSQWLEAGLAPKIADRETLRLTRKVYGKQLTTLKRLRGNPVSKAAARHEASVRRLILEAFERAQNTVSVASLEKALAKQDVPWHLLTGVVSTLETHLG